MANEEHILVEEIFLRCQQCGGERIAYPKDPIIGAKALIAFLDSGAIPRCPCGATKADIMFRPRVVGSA